MGRRVSSAAFIGRADELRALEAARARTARGQPAVVLVGGEAGVGKTRVVVELTSRGAADGMRVLTGGCVPVGEEVLPYAPFVEVLRALLTELGVHEVRKLAGPSWQELARLAPGLGKPQVGPPGEAAQSRLFEVLLGLIARLSEQTPVTLVIEDLQWSDRSTRDLLAFLVRNLRRERVLLVVTYRSDEAGQERLGPYLAELDRGGRVQRLELARLDRAGTVAQLVGILGTAPATELADAVFARSEGNPFFTEELLVVVRAGSSELPTTLRDLLRGRVQALPERARQVLEVVAVVGRQVPHRLLSAVAGMDDQLLVEALRAAVASQLLVTRPDQDGYDVRHALLREVIDADLLPGERGRLHAGLAQTLTERPELTDGPPAVAAAELAAHWDAAGQPIQALPARVQAGLAAERAHAFAEASRHYERALRLWEQVLDPIRPLGLDRVELLTRAAETAAFTGAVEIAVGWVEDALDRVDSAAETVRTAELLGRLGNHRRVAGDEVGAMAAFERAERLLAGTPPSAEHARVLADHAYTLMLGFQSEGAIARCEQAITVARTVGARTEEAKALRVLAGLLAGAGESDQAITLSLEARRIAEQVGDAETVIGTYQTVSYVLTGAGRERDALENSQQGYQWARELGLERAVGSHVAVNLAFSLLNTGRWADCERIARELLAGDTWGAFELHRALGVLLTRRGEFAAAHEQLDLALRLSPPFSSEAIWRGLAELALWESRHEEAGAAVTEGLRWWAERDPDQAFAQYSSQWYSLALRLQADRAERAAARRAAGTMAEVQRQAAPILAALDQLAATPTLQSRFPLVAVHLLLAQAERSRLEGRSNPERWQAAAAAWEWLERPFHVAYVRFREAEALLADGASRQQAETVLRVAHQTTVALGAAPLRREVELLAQRGRLHLEDPEDTTASTEVPPSPAASLGLTRREVEVLVLVAEGRSNRQIGQALFISPKTASIHVSRILTKLGVASRGEAAAVAHRLGLDEQ